MVLDSSAVLAILQSEPERGSLAAALESAESRLMSVVSFVDCSIVLGSRRGADAVRDFDLFLAKCAVELIPVDSEQAHVARKAHARFGKGNHAAGLNFGECFAYALSEVTGEPLLFKGRDFAMTDVGRHPASVPLR